MRRDCPKRAKTPALSQQPTLLSRKSRGFKLTGPTAESHAVGEHLTDGGSIIENVVGDCPEVKFRVRGVDVGCLIDTGADVSTITESFYKEYLVRVGRWLT